MLKIEVTETKSKTLVALSEQLDDTANFTAISWARANDLEFDLSGLKMINSSGISQWITWSQTLPGYLNISVSNLPPIFVNLWNVIQDMVPSTWRVESFYLPYVCHETQQNRNVLLIHGKNFNNAGLIEPLPPTVVLDPDTQLVWELDVSLSSYVQFLTNRN